MTNVVLPNKQKNDYLGQGRSRAEGLGGLSQRDIVFMGLNTVI